MKYKPLYIKITYHWYNQYKGEPYSEHLSIVGDISDRALLEKKLGAQSTFEGLRVPREVEEQYSNDPFDFL